MSNPDAVVHDLRVLLDKEKGLRNLVERSLVKARQSAESQLKPDLFEALEWPENLDQYEDYLRRYLRWVPRESKAKPWQGLKPEERYAKEVDDRIAHFYYLVDQTVDDQVPQGVESFRCWMTEFARRWGSFLDTAESFSPEILQSFIDNAPEYRVYESLVGGMPNMPSGWLTFNQFIGRELNGGLRPIAEPASNLVVTSPADCIYQQAYDIDNNSNVPPVTVKTANTFGNISQLIKGSAYSESFAGGTFVHYMLPVSAYHRYHLPVAGLVKESFTISGQVFMQVSLENHEFAASDAASSGYEFFQNRGVVTIDTAAAGADDIGIVAVIPVGMAHVSSVMITAVQGKRMAKGEEFGHFQFGGSDIIVLFQEGVEPQVDTSGEYRLVGTPIARCRRRRS
ncbi:phosphatidylserine decarboxylase [Mycobacterium simiae]|uniref:Phosphatidylserine decarboxylase n=1 Tax=Mycobacterium simiae TaxID=1784 RepID=A0A5B1BNP1_MYCSI|nr:phosphatidylserine decarboxylase [Mycobacterium simiae]KAA1249692.1 phosphatidylserine decarboxylase [Mycobacterium simiae]